MSELILCQESYVKSSIRYFYTFHMMTSSNGNIFRVTGHLCGEFTGLRWIPRTKASDASFYVFFDLRLNKRLSKHSCSWSFETLPPPLWRLSKEADGGVIGGINNPVYSRLVFSISSWELKMASHQVRGVSNNWQVDCLLNSLFRRRTKKLSNIRITGYFVSGIHRWPVDSPHRGPVLPESSWIWI